MVHHNAHDIYDDMTYAHYQYCSQHCSPQHHVLTMFIAVSMTDGATDIPISHPQPFWPAPVGQAFRHATIFLLHDLRSEEPQHASCCMQHASAQLPAVSPDSLQPRSSQLAPLDDTCAHSSSTLPSHQPGPQKLPHTRVKGVRALLLKLRGEIVVAARSRDRCKVRSDLCAAAMPMSSTILIILRHFLSNL